MDIPDRDTQQTNRGNSDSNLSQAFSILDSSTNAKARRQAAEALGNPSSAVAEHEQRVVGKLIRTVLTDADDDVRAEAINSLYFQGDDHVEELVERIAETRQYDGDVPALFSEWLQSSRSEFRMVGATAMSAFGSEITSELENALTDDDPRVQARAARAYGTIGTDAVEPLRPLLQTPNPHVRHAAVSALTSIATPKAFDMLASLVRSSDDQLRRIAVKHLYQLDREKSARILVSTLEDRSEMVRRTAMVSLIRLFAEGTSVAPGDVRDRLVGDYAADRETLAETLHTVLSGDDNDHATTETERYAVWLLGELTDEIEPQTALPWLIDALEHPDSVTADIAAAYVPLLEAPRAEKELQMLVSKATEPAVADRAERALDRIRQSAAEAVEQRSIEYTYVRRPADYTQKYSS